MHPRISKSQDTSKSLGSTSAYELRHIHSTFVCSAASIYRRHVHLASPPSRQHPPPPNLIIKSTCVPRPPMPRLRRGLSMRHRCTLRSGVQWQGALVTEQLSLSYDRSEIHLYNSRCRRVHLSHTRSLVHPNQPLSSFTSRRRRVYKRSVSSRQRLLGAI